MLERYKENMDSFSEAELLTVQEKSVCIVGCGGLGGYAGNCLARFGVGRLTLIDGDEFSESNLNRQLFATTKTLGMKKALVTGEKLSEINDRIEINALTLMLSGENAMQLLAGHDIILDCLDSIRARRILAQASGKLNIPLIHGAISGLYGQVGTIFPGDSLLERLYPTGVDESVKGPGNPVFAPNIVASLQGNEAVRILSGRGPGLRNMVLYIDLSSYDFEIVSFQ